MGLPSFSALPIKRKLMLIILLASGIVLWVAFAAFIGYDVFWFRRNMVTDLTTLAETIAANNASALYLEVPERAESSLALLKAKPNISVACIYNTTNGIFASYPTNTVPTVPPKLEPGGHRFDKRGLVIFQPIMFRGEQIGTVYLESTLSELYSRLRHFSGIVAVILLGGFFLVLLLSTKLQSVISEPILELAKATRVVSEEKNYAIRAVKRTEDEVGFLIDGFNDMLSQIERRERALEEANKQLRSRETALEDANKQLVQSEQK